MSLGLGELCGNNFGNFESSQYSRIMVNNLGIIENDIGIIWKISEFCIYSQ